ncbi:MAG: deoxyguanosinetriphosphate triphosphohydrolase, partial [Paracoccaceae bacterium]|nr:deoxyguanosinetriphosphate triphosphohydrolase [Paracoccaceae bacterium]
MYQSYAVNSNNSKGRLFKEEEVDHRSNYQRDRDRIIHSDAFRRLKHKTQVFVAHESDYFRTRLTHSIEVGQIARTISSALGLNVDLTEAIALAHDLGHTAFGHTGEEALNSCMVNFGGFDHNAQAIKIVTKLEKNYASFDGLNLTWETLEGIVKHNGPLSMPINYYLSEYNAVHGLDLDNFPSCEAQVAAVSDDIAYNNHDLSDGLRAGLFELSELYGLPIVGVCLREVDKLYPNIDQSRKCHEGLRRVFAIMVEDVLSQSKKNLSQFSNLETDAVRSHGKKVIGFSNDFLFQLAQIRKFLFEKMYRHWKVNRLRFKASRVIKDLFDMYFEQPDILPEDWGNSAKLLDETERARLICDYIAGMTDQYALMEYRKLTDSNAFMI